MPVRWIALLLGAVVLMACQSEDTGKKAGKGTSLTAAPQAAVPTSQRTETRPSATSPTPTAQVQPRRKLTLVPVSMQLEPSNEAGWQYMLVTLAVRNDGTEATTVEFPETRTSLSVAEGRTYDGTLASEIRSGFRAVPIDRDQFKGFVLPPTFSVCKRDEWWIWAQTRIPVNTTPATLRVPGFDPVTLTDGSISGSCPTSQVARASSVKISQMPFVADVNSKLSINASTSQESTSTFRATALNVVAQNRDRFDGINVDVNVLALDTEGTVWTPMSNAFTGECSLTQHNGDVGPSQSRTFKVCFPPRTYEIFFARISGASFLLAGSSSAAASGIATDARRLMRRLLETPMNASLLPSGATPGRVEEESLADDDKKAGLIGRVQIGLRGPDQFNALGYTLYASAAEAKTWFERRDGEPTAMSGVTQPVKCSDIKLPNEGPMTLCDVLVGNTIVWAMSGTADRQAQRANMTALTGILRGAIQHLEALR